MNSRERFRETMRYGSPDRVPYFEEGLRDDVLLQWREQGHDIELSKIFEIDQRQRVPAALEPQPRLRGLPGTRRHLQKLRQRLDPDDPRRLPKDWPSRTKEWRSRDFLLELQAHHGFFLAMGVEGWDSFLPAIYLLKDDPLLVAELLDTYGYFSARLVERVLRDVDVDFATFSEPIGGNDGPLLSPDTYRRFLIRSYLPIVEALRRNGVETIVFVTYANARALIPTILEAGFTCLWACEAETGAMDYMSLRAEFGRELRLIGGIDLDVLLGDREGIRREVETKVPPLLEQGGYVPLADGRVRANVPYENYVFYRKLLADITRRG